MTVDHSFPCDHLSVHQVGETGWACADCELPFVPVTEFDAELDKVLTSMAIVIDKVAKMNGVADADVDHLIRDNAGRPVGDRMAVQVQEDDGHAHQYGVDIPAGCILCGRKPFLGSD